MLSSPTMTEENNTEASELQVYELGYHILPTVAAEDVEAEVGKIRDAIEKRGGSFITEGTPEVMTLAYPMFVNNGGKQTKYERAYFGWVKFEMDPAQAVALQEEDMTPNANVLRFTLFKTTREETRAQLQTEQSTILREVKNTDTLEKKEVKEEGGEVSEAELEKSIDDLVGDEQTTDENTEETKES